MPYYQRSGNKYRAQRTEYNGAVYHSKLEAAVAQELDLRVKAGDIKSWERQVKLPLSVNGIHITNYYIDFLIENNDGSREFLEAKGVATPEWKLKWSLLEATFDDLFRKHPDDRLTVIKQSSIRYGRW